MRQSVIALTTIMLLIMSTSYSQQPFERLGYTVPISTLSQGKYSEDFTSDSLVQVGSVMLNRVTGKIVSFITYDTMYSEHSLDPQLISRFMSQDPLGEKFYPLSPYNYVANNPILFVDPDGRELVVYFKGKGSNTKFINQINAMFDGQFKLTFTQFKDGDGNAVKGKYTVGIQATEDGGDVSKLTEGQQAFYKGFKQVVDHSVRVDLDVFNGNSKVDVGNYQNNALDVGDTEQFPEYDATKYEQQGPTQGGKIIHEVREQFGKALDGRKKGDWRGYNSNHSRAIGWENSVNGNTRLGDGGNIDSGVIQQFKLKNGSVVKYKIIGHQSQEILIVKPHNK
ncbi:hypothetical protein FNH22_05215 [Fulvivirga sp. M361]|uniref:hypothetical protein n=1 Tax=Fulvivirga sp. M361 TaxID=2594266 RepID=UPI00117AFC45|nr:hypothetical protein [Fulvivirga sp. M361]TRX61455.1 hypothetical protein FNH22_05215 [Fulvivirga sp. M361]